MQATVVHREVQRTRRGEVATEEEETALGVVQHEREVAVELQQSFDAEGAIARADLLGGGCVGADRLAGGAQRGGERVPIVERRVGGNVHGTARGDGCIATQPDTPLPVVALHAQRDAIVVAAPDVHAGARTPTQQDPERGIAVRRRRDCAAEDGGEPRHGREIGEPGSVVRQAATADSRRTSPNVRTSSSHSVRSARRSSTGTSG